MSNDNFINDYRAKRLKEIQEQQDINKSEVLKVNIDLEEKPEAEAAWYDGWLDFDVGSTDNPIHMYSIRVSGPENVIAWGLGEINKLVVGRKLNRAVLDLIKKYLVKWGIEVLAEEKNRETSQEKETI